MILYSKIFRQKNRKVKIVFHIINNSPTEVEIEWLETSYANNVYSLNNEGNNVYSVEFYSKSIEIKATVEGEPGKIYDTFSMQFETEDLPLRVISATQFGVPYSSGKNLNVEIFSESGESLQIVDSTGIQQFYSLRTTPYNSDFYDGSLLQLTIYLNDRALALYNDSWVTLRSMTPYYVRISGLTEASKDPILINKGYINPYYYGKSFGGWVE